MKSSQKMLIINADDFNLTEGVNRAILQCHDRGIVTSTTILINRPLKRAWIRELKKRKDLGLGLHLNVTLGKPVSKPAQIASLLSEAGKFKAFNRVLSLRAKRSNLKCKIATPAENHGGLAMTTIPGLPQCLELQKEWEAQILKFKKIFGRLPTHLDSHHQLHDHPFFLSGLSTLSKRYKLPVRRSKLLGPRPSRGQAPLGRYTTDYLFGDLDPEKYWKASKLKACLKKLPAGISEIMCHPGYHDQDLDKISSFTSGRASELELFSSPTLRKKIRASGIILTHYGLCYT